jgi:BMFP domain-containing protein YqiC
LVAIAWRPVQIRQAFKGELLRLFTALAAQPAYRHCLGVSLVTRSPETPMTQTNNRFFDEAARLMNDAAGVAQGVRREFDTLIRTQAERILNDLDVVKRDEFEAVKEMARLAREENEALKARIAALEAKVEAKPGTPGQG